MALKAKLETLEGLDKALAALYVKRGNEFVLDVEGEEDTGALKRARDREKEAAKAAKEEAAKLTEELEKLKTKIEEEGDNKNKKKGDVEALEASYREKMAKLEKKHADAMAARGEQLKSLLVDNVANQLAAKLSTSPDLLLPHIKARLTADLDSETPATRVLDASGKPSASTLADFEKEILANKTFAPILIGSKASGGGAGGSGSGGGAPNLADYKDDKGNILWSKVAGAAKDNPGLIAQLTGESAPQ